ncbi:hypothetical protein [Bacillus cereus]|uniref:hypothetical protein n=1 Tax=Bacillus cereus TaxID=1396 RepID=UPI00119D9333|nr:hypothetical protein [Bacillus cereus]
MTNMRQQELEFLNNLSTKLRNSNRDHNIIVAHTAEALTLDSDKTTIKVDLDTFGGMPTVVEVKLTKWGKQALLGEMSGQRVILGCFGNFYAVLDVVL